MEAIKKTKNNQRAKANASVEQVMMLMVLMVIFLTVATVRHNVDSSYRIARDNVDAELLSTQLALLAGEANGMSDNSTVAFYISGDPNRLNASIVNNTIVVVTGNLTYFRALNFNITPINLTLNRYITFTKNQSVVVQYA